jgi:hypothetical protein
MDFRNPSLELRMTHLAAERLTAPHNNVVEPLHDVVEPIVPPLPLYSDYDLEAALVAFFESNTYPSYGLLDPLRSICVRNSRKQ